MCGFQAPSKIVQLSFEFSPQAIALDFVLDFDSLPRYNLYPQDSRMASVGNPSLGFVRIIQELASNHPIESYWIKWIQDVNLANDVKGESFSCEDESY